MKCGYLFFVILLDLLDLFFRFSDISIYNRDHVYNRSKVVKPFLQLIDVLLFMLPVLDLNTV